MLRGDASFASGVQNVSTILGPSEGKMNGASVNQAMTSIAPVLRVRATSPYALLRNRRALAVADRSRRRDTACTVTVPTWLKDVRAVDCGVPS